MSALSVQPGGDKTKVFDLISTLVADAKKAYLVNSGEKALDRDVAGIFTTMEKALRENPEFSALVKDANHLAELVQNRVDDIDQAGSPSGSEGAVVAGAKGEHLKVEGGLGRFTVKGSPGKRKA